MEKIDTIETLDETRNRLKLNLLSNTLPLLLGLKEIKTGPQLYDTTDKVSGVLFRLADVEEQVTKITNIATILDRNELFIIEDMISDNNARMFCFEYEDETYLIRRERSFVSIKIKGLINHVSDLKPIADIIETYKQSCGEINYILKGAVGTTVEIAFVTPNYSIPNAYLNIGLITMDIGNTSQEEDLDIYGSELLEEGRINLIEAKSFIKSKASHLLQKFNEHIASMPEHSSDANYEAFETIEYSEDLIKKFLEVAQPSMAYGIDLDLVEILDLTLISELKLEPLAGGAGNKLIVPKKQDVYMFCLYLLILNGSVIETVGEISSVERLIELTSIEECNEQEIYQTESGKIFNKALLKTKDLLSVIVAGGKNVGGLDLSILEAKEMLKAFNNLIFKFDKFIIVNTDKPYCSLYSMLEFAISKMNISAIIKDSLCNIINRHKEARMNAESIEENKNNTKSLEEVPECTLVEWEQERNDANKTDDNQALKTASDEELGNILAAIDAAGALDMLNAITAEDIKPEAESSREIEDEISRNI